MSFILLVISSLMSNVKRLEACRALYTNGIPLSPLDVCTSIGTTASMKYTCVNGAAISQMYLNGNRCIADTNYPFEQAATFGAQCQGATCDYAKIRIYTTGGCTAGSQWSDLAVVTNECIEISNAAYKSWMYYCTANEYGVVQFMESGCVGGIYDKSVVYTHEMCDAASGARIDILTCTNPTTIQSQTVNTPIPTTLVPTEAPTNIPTVLPTTVPTYNPSNEPTVNPVISTTLSQTEYISSTLSSTLSTIRSPTYDCSVPLNANEISCEWYANCLENKFECGADGYALGFGYYFCNQYLNAINENALDHAGRDWVYSHIQCMQQNLAEYITNNDNTGCNSIHEYAYSKHVQCYLDVGTIESVCYLREQDFDAIEQIIHMAPVINPSTAVDDFYWQYVTEISAVCREDYMELYQLVLDYNYADLNKFGDNLITIGFEILYQVFKAKYMKKYMKGQLKDSQIPDLCTPSNCEVLDDLWVLNVTEGSVVITFAAFVNETTFIEVEHLQTLNNISVTIRNISMDVMRFLRLNISNVSIAMTSSTTATATPTDTVDVNVYTSETDENGISLLYIAIIILVICIVVICIGFGVFVCCKENRSKNQYEGVNQTTMEPV